MPFSTGTFSRVHDWTSDRDAGIKISASRTDAEFDGIATGLTTCILKDGTQTLTAMIPFTLGLSVPTDKKIQLRDSAIFINSSGDGELNMAADTSVTITTPSLIITDNTTDEPIVQIKNTHNGTTAGELRFVMDKGAAGADGDDLGTISFFGDDSGQNQTAFAKIVGEVSEADNTDEAGKLSFFVAESDGTNTALTAGLVLEGEHATDGEVDVTIGAGVASTTSVAGVLAVAGGAVFNEDSADVDFRVESNGNANMLFVDAGNDAVLIGMDDVAYAVTNETDYLIVGNPSDAVTGMTFVTSASGYSGINFSSGNSGDDRLAGYIAYDHSADEMVFGGDGNGATLMKLDTNKDLKIQSGDIFFATAGKGINLGVTSNTDSNTLDDYEEGAWTLGDASGGVSFAQEDGFYIKIGRNVSAYGFVNFPTTSHSGVVQINGLPFTIANEDAARGGGNISFQDASASNNITVIGDKNSQLIKFFGGTGANFVNSNFSAKSIYFAIHYYTAA